MGAFKTVYSETFCVHIYEESEISNETKLKKI